MEKSDALSTELLSTLNKRFTSNESFGNTQNGQTNEGKNPFELLAKNEHTETIKNTSTSTQNDTFGENGMTEEKAAEFKALTGNETLSSNETFPNESNVITPQKAELLKESLAQGKPLSND